jgi:hypothetical protein
MKAQARIIEFQFSRVTEIWKEVSSECLQKILHFLCVYNSSNGKTM